MLTNFVEGIKQQMFNQLWKFKLDALLIHHLIIENNLYGMVTRRSLRRVPRRSTTSLFFIGTLYTLRHFWVSTQNMMFKKCSNFHWIILRGFNFMKTVYELFDNPSYALLVLSFHLRLLPNYKNWHDTYL